MDLDMKNMNMLDNIWHMYVVIYIRLIIIFEYANYSRVRNRRHHFYKYDVPSGRIRGTRIR